ncbi:cyclase family protein [Halomarina halobia]|uniref:Cyclase family protein n=1 Tax=Halomarina halobia TaxID=3033386 RepID=A0ABD6AEJ0_9EURY|nr:cyclase family protein [Halomarina sp. PSR21]
MVDVSELLADAPDNWGRWGDDDELGALNWLTAGEVLRGVGAVETGETFTLGVPIGASDGDPVWPTRAPAGHYVTQDQGTIDAGKRDREPFGHTGSADDLVHLHTHGTTHHDALGHVWYDDRLYNGFDARTTNGGLERCGAEHVANHGIVGRAVLVDVARYRGVRALDADERITLEELEGCLDEQGVELGGREILLLRTGCLDYFYAEGADAFYDRYGDSERSDALLEPGITYTPEVVEWFRDNEVPAFCADTITAEQTRSEETGTLIPLHPALLRDLGVVITELVRLDALAEACAADGRYECLFVSGPLKIVGGTAAPANPVAIR